tara:strand:+ start:617 stop:994 length:378 start_codon:yes stop_codon:yes gene_type:complete
MTFRITTRGADASKDGERYRKEVDANDTKTSSWRLVLRDDGKHFMESWVETYHHHSGKSRTSYVTIRLSDEEVADMGDAINGFNIHHHPLHQLTGEYEIPTTHLYAGDEITGSHQTNEDLKIQND